MRNGRTDEKGPEAGTEKWRFAKNISIEASVTIARDGTVYVIGATEFGNNILYAVNKQGKEKWQYKWHGTISPASLGPDGTIYIAAMKPPGGGSFLVAIDSITGKEKWQAKASQDTDYDWLSHIAVSKDGVIYVAAGSRASAFMSDGKLIWSQEFHDGMTTPLFELHNSGPSLSPGEDVIYAYNGRGIHALNSKDGSIKWRYEYKYGVHYAPPVVGADGRVFIGDENNSSMHAFSPDGKKIWTKRFDDMAVGGIIMAMAIGGDGAIYAVMDGKAGDTLMYALAPKDGLVKWDMLLKKAYTSAALSIDKNDRVYYGAGDGNIYVFNPEGKTLGKWSIADDIQATEKMNGFSAISDGIFYVITADGALRAIGK